MILLRPAVYFIVVTIPLLFAAVQPRVWSVYVILIFIAFLSLFWKGNTGFFPLSNKLLIFTVGCFFLITLLQILPLPIYILSFISPSRFDVIGKNNELLGIAKSWQSLSYSFLSSLSWWSFLFSSGLFFFILKDTLHIRRVLKNILLLIICLAIIESVYGLFQALIPTLGVLWVDYIEVSMGDARGTFINRNHFAGFIEMVWPLALGYTLALGYRGSEINLRKLLASDRLNKQILLTLGIAIMLLALLLSRSRAGITGAFIGFLTFGLLTRSAHKKLPRGFWIMGGTMISLIFLYGIKIGFDPIIERFLRISEGSSRIDIWKDSLVMFKEHLLGIGLRNFRHVFPIYNVSTISDTRFLYAHNDYLHLLVEAGIPGFLALISGFFIFLIKSVKKIKQMKPHHDPLRFFLAVGALSGLVSMAFHSFFDFNLHMPANLIYFVILMAIVHSCAWREAPQRSSRLKAEGSKVKTNLAESSRLKAQRLRPIGLKANRAKSSRLKAK
jgi:O-antigen ligase